MDDAPTLEPQVVEVAPAPAVAIGGPRWSLARERPVLLTTPRNVSWYGWQTLVVDGAWMTGLVGAGALGVASSYGPRALSFGAVGLALASAATYAVGPGVVHAVHRRWLVGGASVAGRVLAVPLLGFVSGFALALATPRGSNEVDSGSGAAFGAGAALGLTAGVLGMIAIDAAVAFDRDKPTMDEVE